MGGHRRSLNEDRWNNDEGTGLRDQVLSSQRYNEDISTEQQGDWPLRARQNPSYIIAYISHWVVSSGGGPTVMTWPFVCLKFIHCGLQEKKPKYLHERTALVTHHRSSWGMFQSGSTIFNDHTFRVARRKIPVLT